MVVGVGGSVGGGVETLRDARIALFSALDAELDLGISSASESAVSWRQGAGARLHMTRPGVGEACDLFHA